VPVRWNRAAASSLRLPTGTDAANMRISDAFGVVTAEQEAEPFYVGAEVGCAVAGASDEPGEGGFGLVAGGQPLLDELE
jgi:hypothetical protein